MTAFSEDPYRYKTACLSNGEGTCGAGGGTAVCWENLVFSGLHADIGKRVPSVLKDGFLEVDITLEGSETAY